MKSKQALGVLARIVKEPLLQFLLLGALLFGVDRYVTENSDNPRRIVVDAKRRGDLSELFAEKEGRPPTDQELQQLIVQWSQNEVLYREARLMGLDQGDAMIRDRLILKLRNVLFGNVVVAPPAESELRTWFSTHRAEYDQPELFDFEQFQFSESQDESAAKALEAQLGSGPVPAERAQALRTYEARPAANLASLFGEDDAKKLLGANANAWVAVTSSRAVHLARITRRVPPQPTEFEQVRSRVVREFTEHARKASLSQSLKVIVDQYDIEVAPDRGPSKLRLSRAEPAPRANPIP